MKNFLRAICVLPALLAGTVAYATASNKELEARANAADQRLGTLEGRVNQSLLDLQRQIEKSQQELRNLRGQIEEARHQLESLQQQQRDLYGDVDRRLLVIENGAGGGTPVAGGGSTRAPDAVFADESAVYGDAFAAMKAGRYEEAVRGFQMYLAKYPRGPRADNATYWLGEAQFVQSQFEGALKAFQDVASFPGIAPAGRCDVQGRAVPVRAQGVQERPHHARQGDFDLSRIGSGETGAGEARHDERRGPVSRLKITETFVSIQGEADAVGWPTLFIRLTGCPLRCGYCDTQYSFYGGEWQQVDALIEGARASGVRHVCVTGGEPLAQKACLELMTGLCDAGFAVSLETSGALDIACR